MRLEASLQTLYSKHRGQVAGRPVSNNDIDNILRDSSDRAERRAAWDASKEIGPKAAVQVRELARLRNEAARGLGYRDHFAMALELQELDEGWLFSLLDQLDTSLAPPGSARRLPSTMRSAPASASPPTSRCGRGTTPTPTSRTRRSCRATGSRRRSPRSTR